jgi:acyl carrier protein
VYHHHHHHQRRATSGRIGTFDSCAAASRLIAAALRAVPYSRAVDAELKERIVERESVLAKIRRILIDKLHVELEEASIDPDVALFGTGLGLDSVDALELVIATEDEFDITFPQDALGAALRTLNGVVDLVLELRTVQEAP